MIEDAQSAVTFRGQLHYMVGSGKIMANGEAENFNTEPLPVADCVCLCLYLCLCVCVCSFIWRYFQSNTVRLLFKDWGICSIYQTSILSISDQQGMTHLQSA